MRWIQVLALIALSWGGCQKAEPEAEKSPVVERSDALADRLCACPDRTCGDAVWKEVTAHVQSLSSQRVSPEENKRIKRALSRVSECSNRLGNAELSPR